MTVPPRSKAAWTIKEERHVKRWYGEKSAAQIASELGRSESSIYNRARRLELDAQRGKAARRIFDRAELKRLIGAGLTSSQIAKAMGTGPRHVRWMAQRDLDTTLINKLRANGRLAQRTRNRREA